MKWAVGMTVDLVVEDNMSPAYLGGSPVGNLPQEDSVVSMVPKEGVDMGRTQSLPPLAFVGRVGSF